MDVQIKIPDEVFKADGPDISRRVIEAVAIEGFRSNQLSTYQIRRMLGFESRAEVHEFLWKHGVAWVDYPVEDIERESKLLKELIP